MSHLSPCIFLLWAILTTALGGFYFHHLWKFDRLRCLNITKGVQSGAFKRVMTYSYLLAVPVLLTYTLGFAVIKYEEGYVTLPSGTVFPKPYGSWTAQHQAALFPLNMLWALSWGFEALSHLEELCFWLFLIHTGPSPKSWFKSVYFKIWAGGSATAIILVLIVTAATKDDPLKNEAWLQFVGSSIGLFITLGFLPILWVFPSFVQNVKNEGADAQAVTRLAKFHDLNLTRIIFRFLFVIPILILAIDGLTPHTHTVNESPMWTDLLTMTSSIGCVVQSAITLMIFFPRNVELETQRWLRDPPAKPRRIALSKKFKMSSKASSEPSQVDKDRTKYLLTDSPVHSKVELPAVPYSGHPYPPSAQVAYDHPSQPQSPWDERYDDGAGSALGLTEANLRMHSEIEPRVNPMALYFTSPIDLLDVPRRRIGDE